MADSYPRFTTRPSTTRANSSMCRNNYSSNYVRFVGKLLFLAFFLIAIPSFPSQAPDFVNQKIFNKFWELLHLMFIGIAVSYGLFCRRSVDNGNLDDAHSYVSGMSHVPSIFEEDFSNSMYYSGQGNAGNFNVKNGGFENPYEENVVAQSWSSKYFQGEPTVVLAQPNCGLEKYGEQCSFVDYKPLGLPVRSLRSRPARRAVPEFGNGSSQPSGSHMKGSSQGSNKSRDRGFGGFVSENLEGKLNESDVLRSPVTRPSRSGRRGGRVHSNVTYQGSDIGSSEYSGSQMNDSSDSSTSNKSRDKGFCDLGSENLEISNESDVLGSSLTRRSRFGRTRVRVHSNVTYEGNSNGSSEPSGSQMRDSSDSSNKSGSRGFGDLGSENLEKFNDSDVSSSSIPRRSRSGRMKESLHSNVTYEGFGNGSSESSGSNKSRGSSFGDLDSENPEKIDGSDVLGCLIPPHSRSGRQRERVHSNVAYEGYDNGSSESFGSQMKDWPDSSNKSITRGFGDIGSENPEGESNKSDVLGSPIPWRSRSGRMRDSVHCNVTRPSHFRPLSVDETQFESLKSRSLRSTVSFSSQVSSQSQSPSRLSPSHSSFSESPKSKMNESVKERSPRQSFPPSSPPVLKPTSIKASADASHSRQYGDGSLLGTPARKCFKDELKEFCDSKKDESLGSKQQSSGSLNFNAKPAAPSKASSRGKSVRTFRTSRASVNTTSERNAREVYTKGKSTMGSNETEEAYTGESDPKIGDHNSFCIGLNRQNLGGEPHLLKHTSTENQKTEIQHCPENPASEPGEELERENDDFQVNSDEETMSGTFSIAGSEVDRKAGEFIAKFKEQIRLQRATSVDTPRGLNITGNYFR